MILYIDETRGTVIAVMSQGDGIPWETKYTQLPCQVDISDLPLASLSHLHSSLDYTGQFGQAVIMSNLPLPLFYAQTLTRIAPIIDDTLSSSDPSVQSTLSSALNDLHLIGRMITSLGVFSENEGVDEIGDGELRFMSLGWVVGECEGKLGLQGRDDRMKALKKSEVSLSSFKVTIS
jgi:hypothetical protein